MTEEPHQLDLETDRGEKVLTDDFDFETWRAGWLLALERALGAESALVADFREATATPSGPTILSPEGWVNLGHQAAATRGIQILKAARSAVRRPSDLHHPGPDVDPDLWTHIDHVADEK